MRVVADLHIHSRFSLATSSKLTPAYLDRWGRVKGIDLIGTGDCTHPAWLPELREKLEPAEGGFFRLKPELRREFDSGEALAEGLPAPRSMPEFDGNPRFVLTGEISTIYSLGGRTRKVHHLVVLPDFRAASAFQARLERVGNIASDGRPILGIDSRDLFAALLDADDRSILIPAHIWTPWFSALGARSGFDSIDECYRDLAPRIRAIETGLSSNPPMNWAVSALDRFAVVSNSDAHSPEKLGREATILDMEFSFAGLSAALGGGGPLGDIRETVEFFPQEGKYHYDGHRSCGVSLSPMESAEAGGLCPRCGKPLTPGVVSRVARLADRPMDESAPCPDDFAGTNRRPYRSLVPLTELLGELLGAGPGSKKVQAAYSGLVAGAGSEFSLLLDLSLPEIEALRTGGVSGELLAEAVGRMRSGRVSVRPGYDGEYGVVRVFAPGERVEARSAGAGLFGDSDGPPSPAPTLEPSPPKPAAAMKRGRKTPAPESSAGPAPEEPEAAPFRLDPAQKAAVEHPGGPALVVAGPGSGKTAVLALRVAHLVQGGADPASILALTFTNKAAGELRERIGRTIGPDRAARLTAATFHSFCRSILRDQAETAGIQKDFDILDEGARSSFLLSVALSIPAARRLGSYVEARKRFLLLPGDRSLRLGPGAPEGLRELAAEFGLPDFDPEKDAAYAAYRDALRAEDSLDFDDLVAGTVRLLASRAETAAVFRARYRTIFVDEYQDVNFAQYALVRLLAPDPAADLCVIGDPNQAIYGFRGSDRRFIERFPVDYPGAAVYRLVKSFRCAPGIVGAAGRLVGAELSGTGAAVALSRSEFPTDKAEAEGIAREIDRLVGGTRFFALDSGVADARAPELRSLSECAVLVRAAALAPPLEKALHDHGIPYSLVGEKPWWEEEPCRSILAELRASRPALSPAEAVRAAAEHSAVPPLEAAVDPEGPAERLAAFASGFDDLMAFLDALALGSPGDGWGPRSERVSIMTIHASKGLEFDHVFVAGLEEGVLPFTLFERNEAIVDEERRLLFVAMTRARVGLHLTYARTRNFRGRELSLAPSRFLSELEDLIPLAAAPPLRPRDPQLRLDV